MLRRTSRPKSGIELLTPPTGAQHGFLSGYEVIHDAIAGVRWRFYLVSFLLSLA